MPAPFHEVNAPQTAQAVMPYAPTGTCLKEFARERRGILSSVRHG
jgi:hypothetical protein